MSRWQAQVREKAKALVAGKWVAAAAPEPARPRVQAPAPVASASQGRGPLAPVGPLPLPAPPAGPVRWEDLPEAPWPGGSIGQVYGLPLRRRCRCGLGLADSPQVPECRDCLTVMGSQ